jgi:hypothetical protein
MALDPRILTVGLELAPQLIGIFKDLFRKANPDAPALTDADAIAGLAAALTSSLAKDVAWLAQHPADPT